MPMNIFYDNKNQEWQSLVKKPLNFGKNLLPLNYKNKPIGSCFLVKKINNKVGPLIGILASRANGKDFYGNRSTFIKIQDQLQKHGGISFVMTPERIDEVSVEGYFVDEGKWQKGLFPLPDIFYNRIASYHEEKSSEMRKVQEIANKNRIPIYNPHFFEKWETYKHLIENNVIKYHLPETDIFTDKKQLEAWLEDHQSLFIKPVLSNQGNGISVISKIEDKYVIKTNKWCKSFKNLDDAFAKVSESLRKRKAIIQRKVHLKEYEGNPYDFRILVQRVKDTWLMSGIGVRCAKKGGVTTHVPQGGKIIPLIEVNQEINTDLINKIAIATAHQLERSYGYLCEFSIDLGIDTDDQHWIFEVNAKPMKFDEPDIEMKALNTLIQCFYNDSGFGL